MCCTVLCGKIIPVVVGPETALQQCRQRDSNCHESHQMILHRRSQAYTGTHNQHVLHAHCTRNAVKSQQQQQQQQQRV